MLPHPIQPPLPVPHKFTTHYPPHLLPISRPRVASSFPDLARLSPDQSDSPTDTVDDDHLSSPRSPPLSSGNYNYVNRGSGSFDSPTSPQMYANHPANLAYPPSHSYSTQSNYAIHSASAMRDADHVSAYLSDSPSPVDVHPSTSFSSQSHERFPPSAPNSFHSEGDRFHQIQQDRYSRNPTIEKFSSGNNPHPPSLLDHRRMSEPAVLGSTNPYAAQSSDPTAARYQPFNFAYTPPAAALPRSPASAYVPLLQRGASIGSLRDLRHQQLEYPPLHSDNHLPNWKQDDESFQRPQVESYGSSDGFDEPLSPSRPNFSGGAVGSPSGPQYSPHLESAYGPSPPGTGTSTTSSVAYHNQSQRDTDIGHSPDANNSKTYSFVALPGNAVKKRPRRRYDEIERLYRCSWPDCTKAYGTLNHLNAHVTMQKHGAKRSPNEFKELRKQWRKAKKDSDSPVSGLLRRGMRDDDAHDLYDTHRYGSAPQSHSLHRQYSSHASLRLPSSSSLSHSGSDPRYAASVDDPRYPVDERADPHDLADYNAGHTRQRYSGNSASWQNDMAPSSRTNVSYPYLSSSLPSISHAHQSHIPHIGTHAEPSHSQTQHPLPTPSHGTMNRLPPNSTLFTPLPGYHPPSLLPPLQTGNELAYPTDGYEVYDEDGRPGSQGSQDEYEHRG